jgi:hypothetical protein
MTVYLKNHFICSINSSRISTSKSWYLFVVPKHGPGIHQQLSDYLWAYRPVKYCSFNKDSKNKSLVPIIKESLKFRGTQDRVCKPPPIGFPVCNNQRILREILFRSGIVLKHKLSTRLIRINYVL